MAMKMNINWAIGSAWGAEESGQYAVLGAGSGLHTGYCRSAFARN
jgi:hypothetical protein